MIGRFSRIVGTVTVAGFVAACSGTTGVFPNGAAHPQSAQLSPATPTAATATSGRGPASSRNGSDDTILYNFLSNPSAPTIYNPVGSLALDSSGNILGITTYQSGCSNCTGAVYELVGSTLLVIHRFTIGTGSDGLFPMTGLVSPDSGLHFFGSTEGSNRSGCGEQCGTLYELTKTPSGYSYSRVYVFSPNYADGNGPTNLTADGNTGIIYGTTEGGGDLSCGQGSGAGCGFVFSFAPATGLTVLYKFKGGTKDGNVPMGKLAVNDTSGLIFGTTVEGGTGSCPVDPSYNPGCGVIFELKPTPSGYTESVVHSFGGVEDSDGGEPMTGITRSASGVLYGTTYAGGNATKRDCGGNGCGTVFELTPEGSGTYSESVIYDFNQGPDAEPLIPSGLIAQNGELYGTTNFGGGGDSGCPTLLFQYGCGTVFSTNESSGTTSYFYDFQGPAADGALPGGGVREGSSVIAGRGASLFSKSGRLHYLQSLEAASGGTLDMDAGALYGVTSQGGSGKGGPSTFCPASEGTGCGTIYTIPEPGASVRRNLRFRQGVYRMSRGRNSSQGEISKCAVLSGC